MGGILVFVVVLMGAFLSVTRTIVPEQLHKEQRQIQYLEQKIGECDARGGIANLSPISGYLGCDLPILPRR